MGNPIEQVLNNRYLFTKILWHSREWTAIEIAEEGHLDLFLQYKDEITGYNLEADSEDINRNYHAMDFAAANGRLEVVKWLFYNKQGKNALYALDWAAHNGYLEVIKWLHENKMRRDMDHAFVLAASNGHLEVIKWLQKNIPECSPSSWLFYCPSPVDEAMKNGHFELVEFFREYLDSDYESDE